MKWEKCTVSGFITCNFAKNNLNNQVKDEMGKACRTHGAKRSAHRILVENREGKIRVGRPRSRW
jgi:hypothetical protein